MSTILVVDDMAICREPIAEVLQAHGYKVVCAGNGIEALALLRDDPVDLVLLDVNMPKMDGLAMLGAMRSNPKLKHLPVVLLTDREGKEDILQAAKLGLQGYLLKSQFSLEELLARVQSCLESEPVALATTAAPRTNEGDVAYRNWRASTEERASVAYSSSRLAMRAKTGKRSQPSHGSLPASGRSQPSDSIYSINALKPVITQADLMRLVNEGLALRPLGPTVHNVITVTGNEGCSADDVAEAVSHDQALCIRLLKLANSSAYSRGHLVNNVKAAVQRIGIQELRSLVMTLGVFEQFEGAVAEYVDPRLFWEHSIACGLVATAIAKACDAKNHHDYFLWGLLHDVGRLILLEHASEQYAMTWHAAQKIGVPLEVVEAKMMLLNHCDILEKALEHWQFPRDFIAPVVNHHNSVARISRLGPGHFEAAATVALANRIIHALLIGSSGNEVIYPLDDLVESLNLPASKIVEIVSTISDETNSLKYAMLARCNEHAWSDFKSQIQSRVVTKFRPLCVSAEPGVDAYRMFCERITSGGSNDPPNLGVIYLRDAEELMKLSVEFDAREKAQGSSDTPVVLILGRGKLDAGQQWLSSRRHVILSTPVRISDFISTVAELLS